MATSTERVRRMRQRQRENLQPDPEGAPLRDADELILPAVRATVAALDLGDEDAAVAKLAEQLAAVMDTCREPAWGARWIGPELLRVLGELGATPAARAKVRKPPAKTAPTRLDQLRAARHPGA